MVEFKKYQKSPRIKSFSKRTFGSGFRLCLNLSRAVEQRDDKQPQLADLRESGSIEQDADVVMFVYREAYYLERKQPKLGSIEHAEWQSKMNDVNGLADIILGKQRHGPTGTVKVEFEGIYTKFKDLSKKLTLIFFFCYKFKIYLKCCYVFLYL